MDVRHHAAEAAQGTAANPPLSGRQPPSGCHRFQVKKFMTSNPHKTALNHTDCLCFHQSPARIFSYSSPADVAERLG